MIPFAFINNEGSLWNDPRLAVGVAASGVALLLTTLWLMRRKSRDGRGAAAICLTLSIALHAALIYFLPALPFFGGGNKSQQKDESGLGVTQVTVGDFHPDDVPADHSSKELAADPQTFVSPLPLPAPPVSVPSDTTPLIPDKPDDIAAQPEELAESEEIPSSLTPPVPTDIASDEQPSLAEELLTQWLSDDAGRASGPVNEMGQTDRDAIAPSPSHVDSQADESLLPPVNAQAAASPAHIPGADASDFGARAGGAKRSALLATGGSESTEAAVDAALRFLAADQRADGAWDPATSGAGRETKTLGTDRGGAGKRATNGITGLAVLSMLGAGNTHLTGPYADNVRRGLSYLIRTQQPDGSLAGGATVAEANYCHGMAALAMCEVAAMTGDESAIQCAAAAVRFTIAGQHPTTGGWRYVRGDQGDLSQLGWQAMVLDGAKRASIPIAPHSLTGASRFLRSVRSGQRGGLASYRPGEAPTRTMTAEALATRLLLGENIPAVEIAEAEAFLLGQLPGVGRDNYYGWYYTSLALHQLQDDAWHQWNEAMKSRLISTQMAGGSWPTDDEWGGYGGRVYTTAMATLCLEVYYRHGQRRNAVAQFVGDHEVNR